MKKTLSMITLAAFALMLLGSCAKINGRLDSLEEKIDGIENEEIATIESQVQSIESSIIDLKSIRDKVQAMSDPATGLSKRIEDLKTFVNDELSRYATKDWAEATLVTMAEYEKTCDTVAKIALKVEGFDSSLKACADSLKGWVNGKFGGYYDIATIDAKLAELQEQVDGVDSLSAELAKTREEIDTAKSAIRAEYRAAITSAIETYDGKLTQALRDSIDGVNATIGTLTGRVGILETKVEALKGRVDSLENMIQSVTIVPAYSDGSVKVEDDTLFIDLSVTPKDIVKTLDTVNFTILLNKVQTKAVTLDTVPTDSIKVFTKDAKNGTVSIKAYIKETLAVLGDESLTVAVNVKVVHSKDLTSDYTTEFVPVTLPGPPEGFVDLGVVVGGKPLYWAEKNLGAANPEDYGYYYFWAGTTGYTYDNTNSKWVSAKTMEDLSGGFIKDKAPYYSGSAYTRYTGSDYSTLQPSDDAATATNPKWRTPTKDEFVALAANCVWIWCDGEDEKYKETTTKGYIVYKAKNKEDKGKAKINGFWQKWEASQSKYVPNGASEATGYTTDDTHIFFPAAGGGNGTSLDDEGSHGYYWSSSLYTDSTDDAYNLYFNSSYVNPQNNNRRFIGFSVRPVSD